MPQKPTAFLSYRRQPSDDLARFIYDKLQTLGADVFFDREAINGGRFAAIIEREIINRDCFLVILTPNTLESEWVRREIATALRHEDKVRIIPVTVGFDLGRAILPEEVEGLAEYDAIQYEREYADESVVRIAKAIGLAGATTPQGIASGVNVHQEIGTMSGGTVIGSQMNFGAQSSPSPAHQPPPPSKTPWLASGKWQGIGAIVGILALIVALATVPQIQQMFSAPTPTATQAAFIASDTPAPPIPTATETPAPSETPVPTTPIPASDTPPPPPGDTLTPLAELPTLPPSAVNLRLFATRDSFTLAVVEAVNLSALQFRVVETDSIRSAAMTGFFDILQLTGGAAQAGDCYVLVKDGAAPPLASACGIPARTFKRNVAPADVFWFDDVGEQQRDVAIYQGEVATGQICPGSAAECGIQFALPAAQLSITAACDGADAVFYVSNTGAALLHSVTWDGYYNGEYLLGGTIQPMASGIMNSFFWRFEDTNGAETRIDLQPAEAVTFATGSATITCPQGLSVPMVVPTSVVVVSAYPCDATVVSPGGSASVLLNVVRALPRSNSPLQNAIEWGTMVSVQRKITESGSAQVWYEIFDDTPTRLGWIPAEYAALSASCPP
jgi:hypothetical protein